MGGGPANDHLLITLYSPLPKQLFDAIQQHFPYLEITEYTVSRSASQLLRAPPTQAAPDPVLKRLWSNATVLITLGVLPPDKSYCPNLTLIHLCSAGVDRWTSHPIFADSKIPITTSSGIHGPPISEYLLLTLLARSKHYLALHQGQVEHSWRKLPSSVAFYDHLGARIGILGYGSIGRSCAAACKGLGMRILAYTASPRPTPESREFAGYTIPGASGDPKGTLPDAWYSGTAKDDLHTFLAQDLDVLLVSLPLTKATRGLLSSEELDILARSEKKTFVVNISRGPIIDQEALVSALKEGKLGGAALDVTDPEPLPADSDLWDAPGAMVTPHVSAAGEEYMERAVGVAVENLERRDRGDKLVNEVRRGRGY